MHCSTACSCCSPPPLKIRRQFERTTLRRAEHMGSKPKPLMSPPFYAFRITLGTPYSRLARPSISERAPLAQIPAPNSWASNAAWTGGDGEHSRSDDGVRRVVGRMRGRTLIAEKSPASLYLWCSCYAMYNREASFRSRPSRSGCCFC